MSASATGQMRSALARIDQSLNAFITVDPDAALRRAGTAAHGDLHGWVIGVKDLVDVAGLPTTNGSAHFPARMPERSAKIVGNLERRGAVVIGKTNLNEFAFGVSGYNPGFGPILNPHDRERTAGGSSGGSAVAVATGSCRVAIGTDTSGSIRIPAACCAVWGLKLVGGRRVHGVEPLAPRYDSLGYLARNAQDLLEILRLGPLPPIDSLRVGALEALSAAELPEAHWTLFKQGAWSVHAARFNSSPYLYGNDVRQKLARPIGDVATARVMMRSWRERLSDEADGFDVLVGPVFRGPIPRLKDVLRDYTEGTTGATDRLMKYTPVANALNWPALAFPSPQGPLEVLAPPGRLDAMFSVALALSTGLMESLGTTAPTEV